MWITIENINGKTKFPSAPAVYVVYFREKVVTVKYSLSNRFGDWLMREVRLIRRLDPKANIQHRPRQRAEEAQVSDIITRRTLRRLRLPASDLSVSVP